jgi:Ni/Co efflux regulator RcnB
MNHKNLLAIVFAAGLAATGAASAQDRHDDRDNHDKGRDNGHQQAGHANDHNDQHDQHDSNRGAGAGHNMHKGEHLRPEYNNKKYVVNDWRGRHLSAPPRGYHWVQAGSDYVLVGIATGVIANLLLNN